MHEVKHFVQHMQEENQRVNIPPFALLFSGRDGRTEKVEKQEGRIQSQLRYA